MFIKSSMMVFTLSVGAISPGQDLVVDLVVEQTLMRSLKSTGGLTRGSGMTEDMRNLWTLSVPVTSEYNSAMQDLQT